MSFKRLLYSNSKITGAIVNEPKSKIRCTSGHAILLNYFSTVRDVRKFGVLICEVLKNGKFWLPIHCHSCCYIYNASMHGTLESSI